MTFGAKATALAILQRRWLAPAPRRVQVLYDRAPKGEPYFGHGRTAAQMLQNLLGHFPDLQQEVVPIDRYARGSIDRCAATFYLGAWHDNPIPESFLDDYSNASAPAVWLNYNIWQLGRERLAHALGAEYQGVFVAEPDGGGGNANRGGFRLFDYRGETFFTRGQRPGEGRSTEAVLVEPYTNTTANVLSWMRRNESDRRHAYAIRNKFRWYIADLPFNGMHEEDRYLIFADLLFDMLGKQPTYRSGKPALIRFEDVHAATPHWQLTSLLQLIRSAGVPFAVSLIPTFRDPHGVFGLPGTGRGSIELRECPRFVQWLHEARQGGGSLLMHGCTHQRDEVGNPSGASALDGEFWDVVNDRPFEDESARSVLERLEESVAQMAAVGMSPVGWVTPHYAASSLGNAVFGHAFSWCVGRAGYSPVTSVSGTTVPDEHRFEQSGVSSRQQRMDRIESLRVTPVDPNARLSGQFFPYEIHGDVHGGRFVPENVGFVQPGEWEIDDVLRVARRNRCLRDAWASFYVHPLLTGLRPDGGLGRFPGDIEPLLEMIREIREMGYTFIDLGKWTRANTCPCRPPPLEG